MVEVKTNYRSLVTAQIKRLQELCGQEADLGSDDGIDYLSGALDVTKWIVEVVQVEGGSEEVLAKTFMEMLNADGGTWDGNTAPPLKAIPLDSIAVEVADWAASMGADLDE